MSVHFADDHLTVHVGDVRDVLPTLPAASVHCVVTSPPYWGLRDYGTATWEGGDDACDHKQRNARGDSGRVSTDDRPGNINPAPVDTPIQYRVACGKCGATRIDAQLGLEPTPEEYLANLVGVFREVRRVLRDDGTVWLNLGDSYAVGKTGRADDESLPRPKGGHREGAAPGYGYARPVAPGLKPKDLVGIPWRAAFALQADGWYLRSDIIWSKPNPMPESVTDRPTKAHEYVFLLSKSARYFFDADAVREAHAETDRPQSEKRRLQRMGREVAVVAGGGQSSKGIDDGWVAPTHTMRTNEAGRNIRTVWTIATEPYPGAHFATFPRKLVEPCVKAGCPPDGVVLDPFAGSGTTGFVANALGRRAVLIDLNADYIDQAMKRNAQAPLGIGA